MQWSRVAGVVIGELISRTVGHVDSDARRHAAFDHSCHCKSNGPQDNVGSPWPARPLRAVLTLGTGEAVTSEPDGGIASDDLHHGDGPVVRHYHACGRVDPLLYYFGRELGQRR